MNGKIPRSALWTLGFVLFLALSRDFISNGRPLYCSIGGVSYYPGLRTIWKNPDLPFQEPVLDSIRIYKLWKNFAYDAGAPLVFAPVAFSAGERDPGCTRCRPGSTQPNVRHNYRHWLGTDDVGNDVAAVVIAGARVAVLTGLAAMGMALLFGLSLGALAGFYGDTRLKLRRGSIIWNSIGVPLAWLYAFDMRQYVLQSGGSAAEWLASAFVFLAIVLIFNLLGRAFNRMVYFSKYVTIPADMLVMRSAEVFIAVPKLILLIAVAIILQHNRSIWILISIIGIFSWTGVALFVRAELLRIREMDFISAARGMGYPESLILWKHALPNALRSTLIAAALGVGSAILAEAGLSYLGFGDPGLNGASWGNLLTNSNSGSTSWWVVLPAALAIGGTVMALNAIGESVSEKAR